LCSDVAAIVDDVSLVAARLFPCGITIAPAFFPDPVAYYAQALMTGTCEEEIVMNRLFATLIVAALPAVVLASGDTAQEKFNTVEAAVKPQVSVIALSSEQAEALARVRSEYKARALSLETEYKALMDAVLASPVADNS
jgi:hypothetical protein